MLRYNTIVIVNVGSVRMMCTMVEVKWDGVVSEMVRDKTVWWLSAIRDGEYRYREINKFRDDAKRIVRRRRAAWQKRREREPEAYGEEDPGDEVAGIMRCMCPGSDFA